ncbi:hypothetical protein ACFY0G_02155 [Streptomyces sp. NPDC001552]
MTDDPPRSPWRHLHGELLAIAILAAVALGVAAYRWYQWLT